MFGIGVFRDFAENIAPEYARSNDQGHTMARQGYQRDDWRILTLNDAVEDSLSKILRFGFDIDRNTAKPDDADSIKSQIILWAKHIANEIPGYSNWQEMHDFTLDALTSPDAVPGEDPTPIGTEADLVAKLGNLELMDRYALVRPEIEKANHAHFNLSFTKTRHRRAILDRIPCVYTAENPMPNDLALVFRKIRYAYKLRECLLGQVGYYNGSLELAANMKDDFEFSMYLIQMKLRRPDRLHIFKAPKAMINYITDPGSPLPWNNQFSISRSFDQFGPKQMPLFGVNYIERKLVEVLRLDKDNKKWVELCALLNWPPRDPEYYGEFCIIKMQFGPPEQIETPEIVRIAEHFLAGNLTLIECGYEVINLPLIISLMTYNETKRKTFYTRFLGLTWSDTLLLNEDSPFTEEYEKRAKKAPQTNTVIGYDLTHLVVPDAEFSKGIPLALANYYQVSSRNSNFIFAPKDAAVEYHRKLNLLNETELDQLFSNIPAYPRTATHATKLDTVVSQAIDATLDWAARAVGNHRPIYTGPSGQMLSYARIFLRSSEDPARSGCVKREHPNLEQLRLTLLAGLIGFNQHHSYDESLTASHGLTHGGITLEYKDRIGYRDIIDSKDPFIRDEIGKQLLDAMRAIGKQVIANFQAVAGVLQPPLPGWDEVVQAWFKDTTGRDFLEG